VYQAIGNSLLAPVLVQQGVTSKDVLLDSTLAASEPVLPSLDLEETIESPLLSPAVSTKPVLDRLSMPPMFARFLTPSDDLDCVPTFHNIEDPD